MHTSGTVRATRRAVNVAPDGSTVAWWRATSTLADGVRSERRCVDRDAVAAEVRLARGHLADQPDVLDRSHVARIGDDGGQHERCPPEGVGLRRDYAAHAIVGLVGKVLPRRAMIDSSIHDVRLRGPTINIQHGPPRDGHLERRQCCASGRFDGRLTAVNGAAAAAAHTSNRVAA